MLIRSASAKVIAVAASVSRKQSHWSGVRRCMAWRWRYKGKLQQAFEL
jgi:hypothetical protein